MDKMLSRPVHTCLSVKCRLTIAGDYARLNSKPGARTAIRSASGSLMVPIKPKALRGPRASLDENLEGLDAQ